MTDRSLNGADRRRIGHAGGCQRLFDCLTLMASWRPLQGRWCAAERRFAAVVGGAVLIGVMWRFVHGSEPEAEWMIAVALIALVVNLTVLRMLGRFRDGEIHLRATWLFTRVDVIANLAVIIAGALVWWLQSPMPDLAIGAFLGAYVFKESLGILREAREAERGSAISP